MTIPSLSSTLRGRTIVGYRAVIDGCPYQFVSADVLADASFTAPGSPAAIGSRIAGLIMRDASIDYTVDLLACKPTSGGIDLQLIDGPGKRWSYVFSRRPTARTNLTANITASGTTMSIASNTGFGSSGYAWVDGECVHYNASGSTSLTLDERGALSADGTQSAAAHYVIAGGGRAPQVTNWPIVWEGRRVALYQYNAGDDVAGAGTQVWRGVVSTAPRFDGTTWTLGCDSILSVLDQRFGGDLGSPITPRGIHYLTTPLIVQWGQVDQINGSPSSTAAGQVSLTGYWETQEAFCADLETALQASLAAGGLGGSVYVHAHGAAGWDLEYVTAAAPPYVWFEFRFAPIPLSDVVAPEMPLGCADPRTVGSSFNSPVAFATDWGVMTDPYGDIPQSLTASTSYRLTRQPSGWDQGLGTVPRGIFWLAQARSYTESVLYVDSPYGLPGDPYSAQLSGTSAGQDATATATLAASPIDAAANSVTFELPDTPPGVVVAPTSGAQPFTWTAGNLLEIRLGVELYGDLGLLLAWIVLKAPDYVSVGAMPGLRANDYYAANFNLAWSDASQPHAAITQSRLFSSFGAASLMDIIRGECLAAGRTLVIDLTGRLTTVPIAYATEYAVGQTTIQRSELITTEQLATHEVNGVGLVSDAVYSLDYDPSTSDFGGGTITVRNSAAYAVSPSVRVIKIEQLSQWQSPTGQPLITTPDAILESIRPMLDTLASGYAVDTLITVRSDIAVGATVRYQIPSLYDYSGTVSAGAERTGLVIGRKNGMYEPGVTLTVMTSLDPTAGYAPGAIISAQTNTSGDDWDIDVGAETDMSAWTVGDLIIISKFDTASADTVTGTIAAIAGSTLSVSLDGTWTPSTAPWKVSYAPRDTLIATRQTSAAWVTGSTGSDTYLPARYAP